MNPIIYLGLLCFAVALAGIVDTIWLRYVRPLMAESYGWPDVQPDERIPAVAWVGALAVLTVMFVLLPFVGVAAGY